MCTYSGDRVQRRCRSREVAGGDTQHLSGARHSHISLERLDTDQPNAPLMALQEMGKRGFRRDNSDAQLEELYRNAIQKHAAKHPTTTHNAIKNEPPATKRRKLAPPAPSTASLAPQDQAKSYSSRSIRHPPTSLTPAYPAPPFQAQTQAWQCRNPQCRRGNPGHLAQCAACRTPRYGRAPQL